ncbi:MAG: hypothetical protein IKO76_03575, partial [Butyrivibrio sp.]|nr:hypothetical protein [Butyrivibrio sp.]
EGEKENACNPNANQLVGTVTVSSGQVGRKVTKGTEVEITLDIDISRVAKVSAILPDLGIELFRDAELSELGAVESPMKAMSNLEKEFQITEHTLDMLRKRNINIRDLYLRFNAIKDEYDKYLDLVESDPDRVHVYVQKFYSLQTEIYQLEMDSMDNAGSENDGADIRRMEDDINRYGSAQDKAMLQELKGQLNSVRDTDSKRFVKDKIDDLHGIVISNSFEWLRNIYMLVYEGGFVVFTDKQKAEYWKSQARTAIANNDKNGLRNAIIQLQNLKLSTVGESNSSSLADLRIR